MVAKVLAFQSLQRFVLFYRKVGPFLMNNIGEQGKLILLFYSGIFPVICQFVARFLTRHALLNPLFAAPQSLPVFAGAVETLSRIGDFLHPFVTYFCQPLFKRLCFRRRDWLDNAQKSFRICHISNIHFSIRWFHFQLSQKLGQLTSFTLKLSFQGIPVFPWTRTIG